MKHSIQYRGKTITADSEEELKAKMREIEDKESTIKNKS